MLTNCVLAVLLIASILFAEFLEAVHRPRKATICAIVILIVLLSWRLFNDE